MRMIGHVIGAPAITATRRSVIFSADGSDARLTLVCTSPAAASAAASPVNAIAPAALTPTVLKNDRRSTGAGASSIRRTARFMALLARQKLNFKENCIDRLSTSVDVIRPAVGESKFWFGKPKPGWLNRLKASHRNSTLLRPATAKRF